MIGMTVGAFLTSWIKLPRIDLNVWLMTWMLLFLWLFAISPEEHGLPQILPQQLMIPAAALVALGNGYNTTYNYILAERKCRAAGLDNDQCQLGRRYTALANQAGVLCGAYFCVMLVHFDVFVQKEV